MIKAVDLIEKFKQVLADHWGYIWGTAGIKWTKQKQEQLDQTTDSNRALSRKYGNRWIGHMVADCSGLFAWAFKQLGGTMYHGSNTMYLKWCTAKGELKKGKRSDGVTLKAGTAVFVWNGKSYSHVGLFIGGDTVIEAQGTIHGVVTSKVTDNKWSHWGELKGVDYGASEGQGQSSVPSDDKQFGETFPTLKRGSKGEYVTLLQTKLIQKGYDLGKWGADGDFGSQTEKAVITFQKDNELTPDGVVGEKTWKALNGDSKQILYAVTIKHLTKQQTETIMKTYKDATITEDK